MFTGIVQSQARVNLLKIENNLARLVVNTSPKLLQGLVTGASIAVNGVCLTVVEFEHFSDYGSIAFDVIDETLHVSNLSSLKVGDSVNIERSLKVGDELGGHIVSGHVHCQVVLADKIVTETNCTLRFQLPETWRNYVLAKGFITVNGVSLTVGQVVSEQGFSVHLIPETLQRTNLGVLSVGDKVNLEFDQQTITIVNTIKQLNLSQG
ncbi:riboflavin synthase subunit alpha [Thalassotalea sp. G2M2-11]|uniref:riboflavin synthase subunit alpha n=1 Tax=Thalassotalea sp. G2M2-11 TaxID=2787627 RepID=UPI0019D06EB9|nr:riboflavin synthase subunit alpha [Thalassotalea sp. G2M2-11]